MPEPSELKPTYLRVSPYFCPMTDIVPGWAFWCGKSLLTDTCTIITRVSNYREHAIVHFRAHLHVMGPTLCNAVAAAIGIALCLLLDLSPKMPLLVTERIGQRGIAQQLSVVRFCAPRCIVHESVCDDHRYCKNTELSAWNFFKDINVFKVLRQKAMHYLRIIVRMP